MCADLVNIIAPYAEMTASLKIYMLFTQSVRDVRNIVAYAGMMASLKMLYAVHTKRS